MNKITTPNIKSEQNLTSERIKFTHRDIYLVLILLFLISGIFYYSFANYLFLYQENRTLFFFSKEYFQQFTNKPGGLLEYAGNFLTQGFFNILYGSFILSLIFTLIAIVYLKINKRLSPDGSYSISFIIIPSCLLILFQSNIFWLIHHNLGFLLVGLYFLLSIIPDKKAIWIISIALFPVFFYFSGAYAWIYLCMYILYGFLYEKWVYPALLLIVAAFSFILFKEVLFLQPVDLLINYPLPSRDYFRNPLIFYIAALFIIILPVLIKTSFLIKLKTNYTRFISQYTAPFILILTILLLTKVYDPATANMFKLEKFLYRQEWDELIKYQETCRSSNIIAQYYYNLALSEKGQLCDRMFFGPQDFGPNSLLRPWNSQANINNIFRGVYFFYTIGLINEAHRWAFESMVVQGYRPENIKLLIKTELINGNYRLAEKYLYVLKKTLHYHSWARKYEAMLKNPEMIKSDPELGEKIRLQPKEDFSIRLKNQQENILLLLQTNPDNKKAFEYKIAWALLEKNYGEVVKEIKKMKEMGYTRIPRHIEEAILVYSWRTGQIFDLGGLNISEETEKRFEQYQSSFAIFTKNPSRGRVDIQKAGKNTYWYYLDFK